MKTMIASAAVMAAVGLCGGASAATLQTSASLAVPFPVGTTLEVDAFDAGLGTLLSADIFYSATAYASGDVSCDIACGIAVLARVEVRGPALATVSASAQDQEICQQPPCTLFVEATANLSGTQAVTGASLAALIGTGKLGYVFDIFGGNELQAAEIRITYTYEEAAAVVPLPAALPMLLAGLGGLAAVRRRRGRAG
jgi:hypothetical protein